MFMRLLRPKYFNQHWKHPEQDTQHSPSQPEDKEPAAHLVPVPPSYPYTALDMTTTTATTITYSQGPSSTSHQTELPYAGTVRCDLSASADAQPHSGQLTPDIQGCIQPLTIDGGISPTCQELPTSQNPASTPSDCADDHELQPVLPDETRRYPKKRVLPRTYARVIIAPLTVSFDLYNPENPPGWLRIAHPEGACYFYHQKHKTYTESNIYDTKIMHQVMADICKLQRLSSTGSIPMPEDSHLVINVHYRLDKSLETMYYYADHTNRVIFFLHPYHITKSSKDYSKKIKGVKTYRHLAYEMQAQYWHFVYLFPTCLQPTDDIVAELRDIVLYFVGDVTLSKRSVSRAPYTLDHLLQILSTTNNIHTNTTVENNGFQSAGSMSLLARNMYFFYHYRFMIFHGESYFHVERGIPAFTEHYSDIWKLLTTMISHLTHFSTPDAQVTKSTREIWNGMFTNVALWDKRTKKLDEEYKTSIILSTVMLTVNVGFLAINGVDFTGPDRTTPQIFSYISICFNFACILAATTMQDNVKRERLLDDIQHFLEKRPILGPHVFLFCLGLPSLLMVYGIYCFVLAFSFVCFVGTSVTTWGYVAGAYVTTFAFIALPVYVFLGQRFENDIEVEDDQFPEAASSTSPPVLNPSNGNNAGQNSNDLSDRQSFISRKLSQIAARASDLRGGRSSSAVNGANDIELNNLRQV